MTRSDFEMALDSLTRYLAQRDHSELELRQKLSRRYSRETIEQVLAEALARKWLCEPSELAERVRASLQRRRRGHRYVEQYLKRKGLPSVPRDQDADRENCRDLLQTKFGKADNFSHEEKQKAFRFLRNRGFEDCLIKRVIYEKS